MLDAEATAPMPEESAHDHDVYRPAIEDDLEAMADSSATAFATSTEACATWLRTAGIENCRVLYRRESFLGMALRAPMGLHFGGRVVPAVGIAGVSVPPEHRGAGASRRVMTHVLREARAREEHLSQLYGTTQSLYRSVGYEQAGHCVRYRVFTRRWPRDPRFTVRPLAKGVPDEARALYDAFARAQCGTAARGPYLWARLERARGEDFKGYGLYDASGALRAYAYARQCSDDGEEMELVVQDLAFADAEAGRALLGFFASFGTLSDAVLFKGGPAHPLLMLLEEQHFESRLYEYALNRVVDVAGALRARGYNPTLRATLDLTVTADPVFADNVGTFRLAIEEGVGTVTRVDTPSADALTLDVRALAPLYAGFLSPTQLALAGSLRGSPRGLDLASAAFSGPAPGMPDMY